MSAEVRPHHDGTTSCPMGYPANRRCCAQPTSVILQPPPPTQGRGLRACFASHSTAPPYLPYLLSMAQRKRMNDVLLVKQ
eukprot:CAMPEP_0174305304 /NCGR_PEP_ID=MMETSP0809-20121228/61330_1 /TAXON_ID=73025 ORGANISM="Eutreptiella gymnastica-like, Strain CCMP1594" /NCGR_SAMPLE_ID=MMETSP0809 /ASSEMBLY_ACC=CAM_ASM_000658 /LENGTH=79 /DNA_ID=CAMNT_0015411753 /DNA_START=526 /DNA_END=765 /DNA_ORIENTATION=-